MALGGSARPIDVLLVEDNPGDVRLVREAFETARLANELHAVDRGDEALDVLRQRDSVDVARPDVVLLDLNLPGMDGHELLGEIRDDPSLSDIPVIVLTSSATEAELIRCHEEQADAYLTKPVDAEEFLGLITTVGDFYLRIVDRPTEDA